MEFEPNVEELETEVFLYHLAHLIGDKQNRWF